MSCNSQGPIFSPLLTYNPVSQSIDLHPLQSLSLGAVQFFQACKIVGLIEVKAKDFPLFAISMRSQEKQSSVCSSSSSPITSCDGLRPGIYIAERSSTCEETKSIYLVAAQNNEKMNQKYQDFFASIILYLCEVCVFDISSKYLRASSNSRIPETSLNRVSYILMNSHGKESKECVGEIYKATILPSSNLGNSKMEISQKLEESMFHQEIERILVKETSKSYIIGEIWSTLDKILNQHIVYKNYTNLEEVSCKFTTQMEIIQHLNHNCKEFKQLRDGHTLLTPLQIGKLHAAVEIYEPVLQKTMPAILCRTKQGFLKEMDTINKSQKVLSEFLLDLKSKYFTTRDQQMHEDELMMKIDICEALFEEYEVQPAYGWVVFGDSFQAIWDRKNSQLQGTVQKLELEVEKLREQLKQNMEIISRNNELIMKYEEKVIDFRQMNIKLQEKCTQISQLQSEIVYQNQQIKRFQQSLYGHQKALNQSNQTISNLNLQIESRNQQLKLVQQHLQKANDKIESLEGTRKHLLHQLECSRLLETKALKEIENSEASREQLKRYSGLVADLEAHFHMFKQCEIEKFNYVLSRNMKCFQEVQKESSRLQKENEDLKILVAKLEVQLKQEKTRFRYCQQKTWMLRQAETCEKMNEMGSTTQEGLRKVKIGDVY